MISGWWLEPHTKGPGAHTDPEDDVFYLIEWAMSVLAGDRWTDVPRQRALITVTTSAAPGPLALRIGFCQFP